MGQQFLGRDANVLVFSSSPNCCCGIGGVSVKAGRHLTGHVKGFRMAFAYRNCVCLARKTRAEGLDSALCGTFRRYGPICRVTKSNMYALAMGNARIATGVNKGLIVSARLGLYCATLGRATGEQLAKCCRSLCLGRKRGAFDMDPKFAIGVGPG